MKIAAKIAVARDSAVVAPRAPKTVPEAPAPKPAPASAPLPRWSSTRRMITNAEISCTRIRIKCNIRKTHPSSGPGSRQDRQKFVRLERSATDQTAVDVGHRKQLGGVTGLDTAAVENARSGRDSSIPGRDPPPDESVYFLGLLRGGIAPGADGPHRLVGDDAVLQSTRAAQLQHHFQLPRDHLAGTPGLAVGELLAHAQNGDQPLALRGAELARDQLITLAIQQPPFGMPDHHVFAADVLQHRRRYLAGEGAVCVRGDILSTKAEDRIRSEPARLVQIHERRTHHAYRRRCRRRLRQQLLDQPRGLAARAVHFPVTGNYGSAHEPISDAWG